MDIIFVAAALLSALLHAVWNAAVKASNAPTEAMTAQMIVAALLVVPVLFWTGLPLAASLPWLLASTSLNLATVTGLLRAYETAGFGVTYPVVRALSVLFVVPMTVVLGGERLSIWGLSGVILISLALLGLSLSARRQDTTSRSALLWILLAGVSSAANVYCDANGVRASGSALAYGSVASMANAVLMSVRQSRTIQPISLLRKHLLRTLPIAFGSVASYFLILWAYTGAPIAPMAALRDTSAVFAVLIAVLWLRERMTPLQLAAVALAAAAVPLLRLA